MPWSGPRTLPALRSASRPSAIARASGFVSSTACSAGPCRSSASMRARYFSVSERAVSCPDAIRFWRSAIESSASSKSAAAAVSGDGGCGEAARAVPRGSVRAAAPAAPYRKSARRFTPAPELLRPVMRSSLSLRRLYRSAVRGARRRARRPPCTRGAAARRRRRTRSRDGARSTPRSPERCRPGASRSFRLGARDELGEQRLADAAAPSLRADVDADFGDARVHGARREWRQHRPAQETPFRAFARDEARRREMVGVPALPRRGARLEGRVSGRDPLEEDAAHVFPVARAQRRRASRRARPSRGRSPSERVALAPHVRAAAERARTADPRRRRRRRSPCRTVRGRAERARGASARRASRRGSGSRSGARRARCGGPRTRRTGGAS